MTEPSNNGKPARQRKAQRAPAGSKAPRKYGRPPKLTPDRADKIIAAIRAGSYDSIACQAAGIHEATFYRWLAEADDDEAAGRRTARRDFRERVVRARGEAELEAIALLRRGAQDRTVTGPDGKPLFLAGDWRAAESYLRSKSPERWAQNRDLTRLLERRLELQERLAERVTLAFEQAIAGLALDAAARARAVLVFAEGLSALEGPDELDGIVNGQARELPAGD